MLGWALIREGANSRIYGMHQCTDSMGHSAGAHETLEMLGGILDSFDQPEQSSIEQGRAKASKVVRCLVKCRIRLKWA